MSDGQKQTPTSDTPKEAQITVFIVIDGERREYGLDYWGGSESGLNWSQGADLSNKIFETLNSALWTDEGVSKIPGLAGDGDIPGED